jgi:hypothetical protein
MNSGFQLGLYSDKRISLHKRQVIFQRILKSSENLVPLGAVAYQGILFGVGEVQQIQLRTEGRENGALEVVGVPLNLQRSETRVLIRLLRMYFPWNWEFDSALSKLRNFGGGGG